MIDTDKYEGHTEGKWNVLVSSQEDIAQAYLHDETAGYYFFSQGFNREQEENYNRNESRANARLMSDAPLLLAEVKRLREQGRKLVEAAERVRSEISDQDTGWYYQLGNHIEKMNRLVKE